MEQKSTLVGFNGGNAEQIIINLFSNEANKDMPYLTRNMMMLTVKQDLTLTRT